MTLDQRAQQLAELLAKAAFGKLVSAPWGDGTSPLGMSNLFDSGNEHTLMECAPEEYTDAIAESLNHLPALLAEREAMRAELTALRAAQANALAIIGNVEHRGGGSNSAKMYADMLNDIRDCLAQPLPPGDGHDPA